MNENIIIVFVWPPSPPPPLQQKINKTRGQSLNDDDYQSESEHPKYNSLVDHFFL